jgi:hypothetical protein
MRKYDDEEVVSIMQEIQWRDKEIKELQDVITNSQMELGSNQQPKNWIKILSITFVSLIISGLPVFAYGRNAWQTTAYYINKALWETKEWWY